LSDSTGTFFKVWDDTSGGHFNYNQFSGYVQSITGGANLTFPTSDCSGPAYIQTAVGQTITNPNYYPNNYAINLVTYTNGGFYKIVNTSITLALGDSYSFLVSVSKLWKWRECLYQQ